MIKEEKQATLSELDKNNWGSSPVPKTSFLFERSVLLLGLIFNFAFLFPTKNTLYAIIDGPLKVKETDRFSKCYRKSTF